MRVLVTGAGKRIGAAIAEAFAAAGADVVIHCNHSMAEATALQERLAARSPERKHQVIQKDLLVLGAVEALFDQALAQGPLDVVVNNASSYSRVALGDETAAELSSAMGINFVVPYAVMREYHRRCASGQVINLLDYRVEMADGRSGGYALAKKALKDATEAAAVSWAPSFRVNGIAPGIVMPGDGVPWERMERLIAGIPTRRRTPETDVAQAAVFIASMASMNGQILYLDGGLHLLGADSLGESSGRKGTAERP